MWFYVWLRFELSLEFVYCFAILFPQTPLQPRNLLTTSQITIADITAPKTLHNPFLLISLPVTNSLAYPICSMCSRFCLLVQASPVICQSKSDLPPPRNFPPTSLSQNLLAFPSLPFLSFKNPLDLTPSYPISKKPHLQPICFIPCVYPVKVSQVWDFLHLINVLK